ncbi:phage tail tape measure protein, partial [Pseudomonas fragi]|nr:phage tail tape measure protein [Pseudomonas sp. GC01]
SKNAKEAIAALGAGAGGAGISMLAMVGAITAAAAALGVLIYAYNKGSKEADAYNNALILTGNYAGTTAANLSAMAKRVGNATTTVADASAALAQLAGSAKIPVAQFEMISTSALQMEDATGKAVRETIAEFERIADSPTKAIAALNEKYGFLTASVYEQVRALEHHGDRQAAAVIAENAYAAAMDARSEQIKKNLGVIERAWDDVTSAAKSGWDAIFDIGRKDTSGPDVTKIQQKINYLKSTLGSGYEDADTQAQIKALQAQVDAVNKINSAARERAAAEGEATRIQREGQAAYEKFQQGLESNFSKRQKMGKALKVGQEEINKARLAGYKITTEQEAAALKAIRDNPIYKEPKTPKGKPYTEDAGQKMLDQARQQFAVLQQQNSLIGLQKGEVDKLGASGLTLIKWEQELADIKGKKTLTADQKSLIANQDLITAQLKRNAGLERENELRKTAAEEVAKLSAFQANQDSRLATAQDGLDANIAGIGLGDKARARLKEDLAIQKDYARQSAALLEQFNTKRISPDLYAKENAIVQEGLAKRLLMQQDNYNQQDAAQSNWLAGASSAWQNYFDIATDYNQQTQDATAQMLGSTTTSISDQIQGLIKGTTSLGDAFINLGSTMGSSVLQALSDIAAKWVVVHALKMAGIGAETTETVASEGIKAAAKVSGDAIATGSTLASLATTVAANVSAAATTIASWLPAALVASIGSFGAAAVVGGTALIAAYALIKGFSSGGYTGAGGVNEPAGMVHKGEVVWSQSDISRFGGVAAVESLRKGNVTPFGAARTGAVGTSASKASAVSASTSLTVNLIESPNKAGQVERGRNSDGTESLSLFVAQIRSGGNETSDAFESTYNLKRHAG